ncbi:class I glutamine amidotransferase-like protein [Massarina eburnea CBS 473.64]|uniref:Class I glutamine amidotransferase-like protein n=1 Tax=Massarina eburnea CBS 473.64 TaxID=1395130 RepID=A0A6A6RMB1_9PLEO|nr:class I glutamine amidotransferase-like protein [Massarina eburnea CBS 473.64]
MAPVYNIAVLLYPNADILDFSGPVEIYTTDPPPGTPRAFHTTTFSHCNPVKASSGALTYIPDTTFSSISTRLADFDILLVPGAQPENITHLLSTDEGAQILDLIKRFATLVPRKETGHRILQSVCTGAMFLAAAGVLAGKEVTTHHLYLNEIVELADRAAGGEGLSGVKVVGRRWVDAGSSREGVRIVTAGGVSSGIDASLWVVERLAGREVAKWAGEVVEFEGRGEVGFGAGRE